MKAKLHFTSGGSCDANEMETIKFISNQTTDLVKKKIRTTSNVKGRANDDARGFKQSIVYAGAPGSPEPGRKQPSVRDMSKVFGLPKPTGARMLKAEKCKKNAKKWSIYPQLEHSQVTKGFLAKKNHSSKGGALMNGFGAIIV